MPQKRASESTKGWEASRPIEGSPDIMIDTLIVKFVCSSSTMQGIDVDVYLHVRQHRHTKQMHPKSKKAGGLQTLLRGHTRSHSTMFAIPNRSGPG